MRKSKSIQNLLAIAVFLGGTSIGLADDKPATPRPKDITLTTKDGVMLRCTYYEGTLGKRSVPIIAIHDWEGQRGDYDRLARAFQSRGHTVIAPDLRGHGRSRRRKLPNGNDQEIDREKFTKNAVAAMVYDVVAVKKYLVERNNDGKCNIEQLCVIGSGVGAIVAMNWAVYDWTRPVLPAYKLGQDVKAMVLVSPKQSFKGLTTRTALSHPIVAGRLSTMVVVGKKDRGYSDAKRLFKSFERAHPKPPKDRKEAIEKQDLFLIEPDTSLSGTRLLIAPGLRPNVPQALLGFINARLVAKAGRFTWQKRSNPLSEDKSD